MFSLKGPRYNRRMLSEVAGHERREYICRRLNLIVAAMAIGTQRFPITNLKSI